MAIVYPDNDKRHDRVIELATNAQSYLYDGTQKYKTFQSYLSQLNKSIADLWTACKQPLAPSVTTVDIVAQQEIAEGIGAGIRAVDVSAVAIDALGATLSVLKFAPAVTRLLVSEGFITAETAAKQLGKFTIPIVDKEIAITAGDLVGNVVAGIASGIITAGFDLGMEAIDGKIIENKLRTATNNIFVLRLTTRLNRDQCDPVNRAVQSMTDIAMFTDTTQTYTAEQLNNIFAKVVQPAIAQMNSITTESTYNSMKLEDVESKSWTNEDPIPTFNQGSVSWSF